MVLLSIGLTKLAALNNLRLAGRVNGLRLLSAGLAEDGSQRSEKRHLSSSGGGGQPGGTQIENVLIVGGGFMGSGIAQTCALSGRFASITVQERDAGRLAYSRQFITKSLANLKRKQLVPAEQVADPEAVAARIELTTDASRPADSFGPNLLVIEAITEVLELKQALFKELALRFSGHSSVVFASNTSSLRLTEIGRTLPDRTSKGRFGGLHFLDALLSPVVEVARAEWTSDQTLDTLKCFAGQLGKRPILCKDVEGFIANRLQMPMLLEALRMVDEGEAGVEDIDAAMCLGYRHPLGPFQLLDFIGLDLIQTVVASWKGSDNGGAGGGHRRSSATLDRLVAQGRLGRKTGRGFYDYGGGVDGKSSPK